MLEFFFFSIEKKQKQKQKKNMLELREIKSAPDLNNFCCAKLNSHQKSIFRLAPN